MKLYMHPVSMTSRPVRLLIAENGLDVEEQVVDILVGEHLKPPYALLNPNKLVPTLVEDDGFRLTESSAILKYLAGKFQLPSYPTALRPRAKVDEMMDWFNTQFYRDFGYGLAYPQLFPNHKRPTDDLQQGTISWGKNLAKGWFQILNDYWLGPEKQYLCGDQITIADYFGSCLATLGEVIRCDFSTYPNVERWLGNMKRLKTWNRTNEALYGFINAVKGQPFIAL